MSEPNSYRTILKSSSIIGGASVVNILVGLVRNKAAALLLGPAGIGVIGLLVSLMQTAASLSSLGISSVGTREVALAAAKDDPAEIAAIRRALFLGMVGLSLVGGVTFWLLRDVLAAKIAGDPLQASTIGWLSLGVFLSVAGVSQQALLNGLRRIGDLAWVQIWSAVISTVLAVGALAIWGQGGILIYVLSTPIASFVMGYVFVRRLDRPVPRGGHIRDVLVRWRGMVGLGSAFMVSSLVLSVGNLALRTVVQRSLGAVALGQFQATWTISMTYISFVLSAMATDYYPRLTAVIDQPDVAVRTVNEQTEVALLLSGPILIGMLATAPWVIHLLYSAEFAPAAGILRWQVLGDILKVASWPLGFVLLAAGAGRTFLITEIIFMLILVLGTMFGIPTFGVVATGFSFALMYVVCLPVLYWLARRRIGMRWTGTVRRQVITLVVLAFALIVTATYSEVLAAIIGIISAVILALTGLRRLAQMTELPASLTLIVRIGGKLLRPFRG